MTRETPRDVRERAQAYEARIILGDVWLEVPGRESAIAVIPRRETTGSSAESWR
ncbi:MAG: hypothetical protein ACLPKB_19645 [Xanthobacteraceae bacterium]